MSFSSLSPLAFGLGLAGLAGLLYLLQRLRVRHREVQVVTTLFWHEAVHETRARVRTQRFRHPWAYALILAICALLWATVAEPLAAARDGRQYVCLLDTSADMASGERFALARSALGEWVQALPKQQRTVLTAGATGRPLLLPGEESSLLEERLAQLEPRPEPSSLQAQLADLARTHGGELTVYVFGGRPLDPHFEAALPEGMELHFLSPEGPEEPQGFGISALGVSAAASGAWDAVDVFVEVRGPAGAEAGTFPRLAAELDGVSDDLRPIDLGGMDRRRYLFREVPATGGLFSARVLGTDNLDGHARLRLPVRPRLRVAVAPELLEAVGPALEADPAVLLADDAPDVVITNGAEDHGVPTLRFVPAAAQSESFLLTYADERSAELLLQEALGSLGLADIDPAGLAQSARVPITLGARAGARRELAVWKELIGEEFDFRDSRAFPLFVARSLRWLVNAPPITPWVAAGEPVAGPGPFTNAAGLRLDPVGLRFTPALAGDYASPSGDPWHASLIDAPTRAPVVAAAPTDLELPASDRDLVGWLLLIAFLLLGWEWVLVRREQIP